MNQPQSEKERTNIWPNRRSMDEWQLYCSRHPESEDLLPQIPEDCHERVWSEIYHKRSEMMDTLISEDKASSPEARSAYEFEELYDALMDQDEYYFSMLYWELRARGYFHNEPEARFARFSDEQLLELWAKKEAGEIA